MSARQVIVCNYIEATNVAAVGAKAYVCLTDPGGGGERPVVLVRSRSGRFVEKHENVRRLGNFRLKVLPPEHPRYGDERVIDYGADEVAMLRLAAERRRRS